MVLLAALLAALTALRQLGIIEQLVAWAFSLAAATIFPALVLGIFWKRANGKGAVAGMLAGLAVTLSYMLATLTNPDLAVLGIGDRAAGIWGVPVNLLVTWLVSSLTSAPSAQTRALVDLVRSPENTDA
jgi:cation/acetate symporter